MSNAALELDRLLHPIHPERPAGEDVSFENAYTDIQEARRADDPTAAQGEWEADIKGAGWARVVQLAEQVLATQSKDIQVAMWLVEGLTYQHGLEGLAKGLELLSQFIDRFWDSCYPQLDDYGLEERIGRFEWLDRSLPAALQQISITRREEGRFVAFDWYVAKDLEQLAVRDPSAFQEAVAAGRPTLEVLEKSVAASGAPFYENLYQNMRQVRTSFDRFHGLVDQQLGDDAPGFAQSRAALDRLDDLVSRFAQRFGSKSAQAAEPQKASDVGTTVSVPVMPALTGPIASRADAIRCLHEVAAFFRRTEPHSPAAYLAEKAARWADLPLDQWLRQVLKDEGSLSHVQELLGIRGENS